MRRPLSIPYAIMAEIQRKFLEQGYKVGDRLPSERQLAQQLSVGRSSLREAMHGLQMMGLVEVRHGVGTFFVSEPGIWLLSSVRLVDAPSQSLFAELIEARLLVEVRLAALAAERATPAEIVRIRGCADERVHAQQGDYVERGLEFHLAIAEAAHHSVLASMLKAVSHLYFDALDKLDTVAQGRVASFASRQLAGHEAIIAMIEARDPTGAAEAMSSHLRALQSEFPKITRPSVTAIYERETVQ